jgi:branched-chain amino acid transport system ATP-binding protein
MFVTDETPTLLEVRGLDAHYGHIQALRAVSLDVDAGEMVALVGANGAGKTTLLRAVSGLLSPSNGTISLNGDRIDGLPAHAVVRRGVAHLPEGRELFGGLTVLENLQLGGWIRGGDRTGTAASLDEALELFPRLRERASQNASTLSGGEQQMLGVARALMSDPRLLIIDELSLGLAPLIVNQLFDILREVNQRGTAVLIVEQFVHMALGNTNRAYVLSKGEVVMSGPSADLLADPHLVETYLGAMDRAH